MGRCTAATKRRFARKPPVTTTIHDLKFYEYFIFVDCISSTFWLSFIGAFYEHFVPCVRTVR